MSRQALTLSRSSVSLDSARCWLVSGISSVHRVIVRSKSRADLGLLTWCSDDLLLAGDAAARHYVDPQSAAAQRRLQHQQQHQQQQQAADMYLEQFEQQQQQQQQLQDQQQQASMAVQLGSAHAVYLQQDGSHVVGPEAPSAAYPRAADQYGGSLQEPPQYAAPEVVAGFGSEVLSDGFGDLRHGGSGAQCTQGSRHYDADQIMRIASQDLPGFSGRWPGDDGADGAQYCRGAGGSGTTLPEIDWYDPRVAEQQLLAHRQQQHQHQQLLSSGYDCGESSGGDQGAGADALPRQPQGWIPGQIH